MSRGDQHIQVVVFSRTKKKKKTKMIQLIKWKNSQLGGLMGFRFLLVISNALVHYVLHH